MQKVKGVGCSLGIEEVKNLCFVENRKRDKEDQKGFEA